jgi:GT2 family glycosyltransferase
VVIVSRNCAGALKKCLGSLMLSKARETTEVFVVDNGSTDESPQLDAEFPGVTFLRLPRNFGRVKARNIAIRSATADLLMFLSPFVTLAPDAIGILTSRLGADSQTAAVVPLLTSADGVPVAFYGSLPSAANQWRPIEAPPPASKDPMAVECASDIALMVRKTFLKGMNYFDEHYGDSWADRDLCFQIRNAARKILLVPAATGECDPPGPPADTAGRALVSADAALGASRYIEKRNGWLAGFSHHLGQIVGALGSTLIFREPSYNFARFRFLATGQKIDGTQGDWA